MQDQTGSSTLAVLADRLCYRVDLSAEDRAAILELPFTLKITEPHQYIVREREPTTHSCIMLSGFSVRSKIVGSGHRQILAIHMKGDAVDLQNSLLEVSDHSVHMLTAGKVAMIPREAILALTLDRPRIAQAMWLDTLVDGSVFREWITNVGRRQARSRIAHLFCEFSLRLKLAGLGENNLYELPMTQEQLADATGLTPVHVNRSIKALEADGLITRSSPRSIFIGDWHKLAAEGDFDSQYLHLRKDEPALR